MAEVSQQTQTGALPDRWVVYAEKLGLPLLCYTTEDAAVAEARRTALQTKSRVWVLEALGSFVPVSPQVEWVGAYGNQAAQHRAKE